MTSKWQKINGMVAAVYTPMHSDGAINLSSIANYAKHLKANGVKGAFVNGTNGESMSLTVEERKTVASEWMKHKSQTFKIIIHCGAGNLEESKILAKHAQNVQADAISAMVPSFFKAGDADTVVSYIQAVAASAPTTPFFYYHFPTMTGVTAKFEEIISKGVERIPTLSGAKFTSVETNEAAAIADAFKHLEIFSGFDQLRLSSLSMGITSSISAGANFMAPAMVRLLTLFEEGKHQECLDIQLAMTRYFNIICQHGKGHFIPTGKAAMKLFDMDLGPVRLPLVNALPVNVEEAIVELKQTGFDNFIAS